MIVRSLTGSSNEDAIRETLQELHGPLEVVKYPFATMHAMFHRTRAPIADLFRPWISLFETQPSAIAWLDQLWRSLVAIAIVTFAGAVIARLTVASLTQHDRPGLVAASRWAALRIHRLLGASLGPAIGIGLLAIIATIFGLLYRVPEPAAGWLRPIVFSILLVLAIPMAWLVVVMIAGCPLCVVSIATEDNDQLETLSRSFGYLFRRKALILSIATAGFASIALGQWLFAWFLDLVAHLARWASGPGAGGTPDLPPFWSWLQPLIVSAWIVSAFWSLVCAIYLIVRAEVDGTPVRHFQVRPS